MVIQADNASFEFSNIPLIHVGQLDDAGKAFRKHVIEGEFSNVMKTACHKGLRRGQIAAGSMGGGDHFCSHAYRKAVPPKIDTIKAIQVIAGIRIVLRPPTVMARMGGGLKRFEYFN